MKKYEVMDRKTGHVFNYYDTYDEAERGIIYANICYKDRSYMIVELPEVEEPEVDYELIDCLINEMIDNMEQIFKLTKIDHISLTYTTNPETNNTGAFMSAWSGEKYGVTYIGNRANIFKRIYNQIKAGEKNEVIQNESKSYLL